MRIAQEKGRTAALAQEESKGWAETTLKRLTLEEKIGQMLQVRYFADYKSFDRGDYLQLRDALRKYHIGSLVYGMHITKSGAWIRVSARDAARVANRLQRDSQLPLLLAADLERGVAPRLTDAPDFPWPMAFGAIGDPSEVERLGAVTAREARAIGIQWVLAPVADVNSNPSNPVINTRSFGEDPVQVSAMVQAFIRGARLPDGQAGRGGQAHEEGVLVTAKHFPGHGESLVDSHHGVAVLSTSGSGIACGATALPGGLRDPRPSVTFSRTSDFREKAEGAARMARDVSGPAKKSAAEKLLTRCLLRRPGVWKTRARRMRVLLVS